MTNLLLNLDVFMKNCPKVRGWINVNACQSFRFIKKFSCNKSTLDHSLTDGQDNLITMNDNELEMCKVHFNKLIFELLTLNIHSPFKPSEATQIIRDTHQR